MAREGTEAYIECMRIIDAVDQEDRNDMTKKDQTQIKLELAAMVEGKRQLNGTRSWPRKGTNIVFVELPKALWRSAGNCSCGVCKGAEGFWDTLAVLTDKPGTTYTVHHPNGWKDAAGLPR